MEETRKEKLIEKIEEMAEVCQPVELTVEDIPEGLSKTEMAAGAIVVSAIIGGAVYGFKKLKNWKAERDDKKRREIEDVYYERLCKMGLIKEELDDVDIEEESDN